MHPQTAQRMRENSPGKQVTCTEPLTFRAINKDLWLPRSLDCSNLLQLLGKQADSAGDIVPLLRDRIIGMRRRPRQSDFPIGRVAFPQNTAKADSSLLNGSRMGAAIHHQTG